MASWFTGPFLNTKWQSSPLLILKGLSFCLHFYHFDNHPSRYKNNKTFGIHLPLTSTGCRSWKYPSKRCWCPSHTSNILLSKHYFPCFPWIYNLLTDFSRIKKTALGAFIYYVPHYGELIWDNTWKYFSADYIQLYLIWKMFMAFSLRNSLGFSLLTVDPSANWVSITSGEYIVAGGWGLCCGIGWSLPGCPLYECV